MVTPQDFIHRLKSQNYILNKQYHVKVLLKRFHLNGHIMDFIHRLKSQNYVLNKQYYVKVLLKRFHLNGNTKGFHQTPSSTLGAKTLRKFFVAIVIIITTKEKVSTVMNLVKAEFSRQKKQTELGTLGELIVPFRYSCSLTPRKRPALTQLL